MGIELKTSGLWDLRAADCAIAAVLIDRPDISAGG
jgi:hypothetical protein